MRKIERDIERKRAMESNDGVLPVAKSVQESHCRKKVEKECVRLERQKESKVKRRIEEKEKEKRGDRGKA